MRKDPGYVGRMRMRVLDGSGGEIDPRLGGLAFRPRAEFHHPAGFRRLATRSARCASTCPIRIRSTCTTPTTRSSSAPTTASSPPAARGCRESARSRGLAAGRTSRAGAAARSTPRSPTGERRTCGSTHKVPVAWVYLTGWVTRDDVDAFPRRRLQSRREAGPGGRSVASADGERRARIAASCSSRGGAGPLRSSRCRFSIINDPA